MVGPRSVIAGLALVAAVTCSGCASASLGQPTATSGVSVAAANQVVVTTGSTAPPMPGTDSKIQGWFKGVEKVRIAFNNALFLAEKDIAAGTSTTNCAALRSLTGQILVQLPKLAALPHGGADVAAQYTPPVQQFQQVAVDCVAGNFPLARSELAAAVAAYGKAQYNVDEILDAGA